MLYVEMDKALYGLLKSALLFCRKLRKYLEAYGFVIDPYYPCVANSMIESRQMMVTWHVDNIKISNKYPYQVIKFASYLSITYREKLIVKRGNVHEYLGMDLDCS